MIYKYCRRCGKRLKSAEARKRGFGKTCFAKHSAEQSRPTLVPLQLTFFAELEQESRAEQTKQSRAKHREQSREQSEAKRRAKSKSEGEKSSEGKRSGMPSPLEIALTHPCQKHLLFNPLASPRAPQNER